MVFTHVSTLLKFGCHAIGAAERRRSFFAGGKRSACFLGNPDPDKAFAHSPSAGMFRMDGLQSLLRGLWRDEEAATSVEYAVMLGLILMVIIGAIGLLGTQTSGLWNTIDADIQTHGVGS